ncbi:hypothetical protein [Devosia sp. FJ2-5-3]|uniref:hypothetical protein n=1 Tax=Devosia sp. FJ2-5-3 TaxID=2976680 RepID=UPI0023D7C6AF|nr:hypothetical protein [Devosia sp. FJ2-5-3]WEJ60198.1 hypothetical protein N0P34_09250 [Devosia sp. FJ2-5-3]
MTTWKDYEGNPRTVIFGDVEMPLSIKARLPDLPPITDADIAAFCTQGPKQPRPPVTAWKGADMDAYHFEAGVWLHCQTGDQWVPNLNDVTAHVCRDPLRRAS